MSFPLSKLASSVRLLQVKFCRPPYSSRPFSRLLERDRGVDYLQIGFRNCTDVHSLQFQQNCAELSLPSSGSELKVPMRSASLARGGRADAGPKLLISYEDLALPELPWDIEEVQSCVPRDIFSIAKTMIGIDPDNSGAVAAIRLDNTSSNFRLALRECDVLLFDMPCKPMLVGKRRRRQADPAAVVTIIKQLSSSLKSGAELLAVIEEPVPNPSNGKMSMFGSGYSFGLWSGVLASHRSGVSTVSARRWKMDLGLNKCGKEGSRALALALFPKADHLLRRKKDHGRAEAMLILAWALGLRISKDSPTAARLALLGFKEKAADPVLSLDCAAGHAVAESSHSSWEPLGCTT